MADQRELDITVATVVIIKTKRSRPIRKKLSEREEIFHINLLKGLKVKPQSSFTFFIVWLPST